MPASADRPLWTALRTRPRRTAALVVLMALAGAAEGFGLLTLLPLLESALPAAGPPSRAAGAISALLRALGLAPTMPVLLAVIAAALLAKALFRWVAMAQVAAAVAEVAESLRRRLVRALFRARWPAAAGCAPGALAGSVTRDAFWAGFAYRDACGVLAAAVQLAVYAAAVLAVSWPAGLAALGVGVVGSVVLGAWVRAGRRAGVAQTAASRTLAARLVDVAHALAPIRAMRRERAFRQGLDADAAELRKAEEAHIRATEALRSFDEPILAILGLGALYLALAWARVPLPTLLLVAILFQRMAGRLRAVQSEYQAMAAASSAYAAVEREIEALTAAHEGGGVRVVRDATEPDDATVRPMPARAAHGGPGAVRHRLRAGGMLEHGIALEDVRYTHDARAGLERIRLLVPAGALVAVVGPTGAGKTTLLEIVAGLRTPLAGVVRADGAPLGALGGAWGARLGYLAQESAILRGTIRENVAFGRAGLGDAAIRRALLSAGAGPLLSTLPAGLDTWVGERGGRLSGGERRRLALARALAGSPAVLLLDEPTAELDAVSAAGIAATLGALGRGITVLVATHDARVTAVADTVHTLEAGRLAMRAAIAEMAP